MQIHMVALHNTLKIYMSMLLFFLINLLCTGEVYTVFKVILIYDYTWASDTTTVKDRETNHLTLEVKFPRLSPVDSQQTFKNPSL